jgi:hypothetical protein
MKRNYFVSLLAALLLSLVAVTARATTITGAWLIPPPASTTLSSSPTLATVIGNIVPNAAGVYNVTDASTADSLIRNGWLSIPAFGGTYTVTTNGTAVAGGAMQAQPTVSMTGLTVSNVCICEAQTLPATWQTGVVLGCLPGSGAAICEIFNPTAATITPAAVVLNVRSIY